MKKWFAAAVLLMAACTQPEKSTRLLEAQGYTDVEITGYDVWACSEDDWYHTGFTAKTVTGQPVKGTVCAGFLFKGATIRYDLVNQGS